MEWPSSASYNVFFHTLEKISKVDGGVEDQKYKWGQETESQNFLDLVLAKPESEIWVKHNKTLITQNPVSNFQIYLKN